MSPTAYEILLTTMHDFLTLTHIAIFLSRHFDHWFPNRIYLYTWSAQQVTVTQHMHCFFKTSYSPIFFPIFSTSPHRGKWFPFSFNICSAIPDCSVSPRHATFRCSFSFNFRGRHISTLYTLYIKSLQSDENIIILPADKGNATVTMDKVEYSNKLADRISNGGYCKVIKPQP